MKRAEHIREALERYATLPPRKVRVALDCTLMKECGLKGYPLCSWHCHESEWCVVLPSALVGKVQDGEVVWAKQNWNTTEDTVHVLEKEVMSGVWTFLTQTQRDGEWVTAWLKKQKEERKEEFANAG